MALVQVEAHGGKETVEGSKEQRGLYKAEEQTTV